ncbi:Predicted lipoprotein with conserved Yx(FWY)xxD motif [Raineyella antarctica]|uniref:Predicted lipoprotein with conserved Yx(FWY)xxD motif n=1 Tax=Raineyella antarctica TaxID=1577474 RepID=A0A1G6GJJ6_9ACTN|nr:hypothetical protein [Raineyella antarctica]SDB82013.1 Predicted lipoprotein with conserved Yx(FWY)xxD motif [Raineyella antarctica]
MKARSIGAAAALSAVLVLSGCGSGGGSGGGYGSSTSAPPATTTTSPPATSSASAGSTTAGLKVASSSLGTIVVSDTGMTVYQYTKDVKDSGKSACTGGCLVAWPPVLTSQDSPTLQGVTGKVGTITTPEGAKQVTLNGLPLYYWAQDSKPGDVTGQGVQNVWYVVGPNGEMVK